MNASRRTVLVSFLLTACGIAAEAVDDDNPNTSQATTLIKSLVQSLEADAKEVYRGLFVPREHWQDAKIPPQCFGDSKEKANRNYERAKSSFEGDFEVLKSFFGGGRGAYFQPGKLEKVEAAEVVMYKVWFTHGHALQGGVFITGPVVVVEGRAYFAGRMALLPAEN